MATQPAKRKQKKNKRRPLLYVLYRELSPLATEYRGPIAFRNEEKEQDLHTMVLYCEGNISSDGSGILAPVFLNNPSNPGAGFGTPSNWNSMAAIYDEYRVLALEIEYVPANRYSRGSTVTMPVATVIDYDSSGALATYATADRYGSCKMLSLDTPWKRKAFMSGVENSQFLGTASPVNVYCIKVFANNLTVSTMYGKVFWRLRVQFRGTGI